MCDRLWVLDSGLINNFQPVCPPKLLAFDLNSSQLLKQVKIPHDIAVNTTTGKGRLVTLSVQPLSCEVNGSTLVSFNKCNSIFPEKFLILTSQFMICIFNFFYKLYYLIRNFKN